MEVCDGRTSIATLFSYMYWRSLSRLSIRSKPSIRPIVSNRMSSTQTITDSSAARILRLFPNDVNPSIIGSGRTESNSADLEGYDEEQVRLMEEVCIVIDADDKPIGSGSKKTCQPHHHHFNQVRS
jgi:hypothetical protein